MLFISRLITPLEKCHAEPLCLPRLKQVNAFGSPLSVLLEDLLRRLLPWTLARRSWTARPVWASRAQHSTGFRDPCSPNTLLRSVDPGSVGQALMCVVVHLRIVRT
jgi:hypothetical protein